MLIIALMPVLADRIVSYDAQARHILTLNMTAFRRRMATLPATGSLSAHQPPTLMATSA
jgi:hypothetical protein